eukprot:2744540-Prymnesium_polylepis.2
MAPPRLDMSKTATHAKLRSQIRETTTASHAARSPPLCHPSARACAHALQATKESALRARRLAALPRALAPGTAKQARHASYLDG